MSLLRRALVLLLLGAAWSPLTADDPKDDRDGLTGTWKVVSYTRYGKEVLAKDTSMTLTFTRSRMTYVCKGDGLKLGTFDDDKGKYTIGTADKLKTLDVTWADAPSAQLGVYELNGDKLTLNLGHDGADRPKSFVNEGRASADCRLMKLERVK